MIKQIVVLFFLSTAAEAQTGPGFEKISTYLSSLPSNDSPHAAKPGLSYLGGAEIHAWGTSTGANISLKDYFRPAIGSFRANSFDGSSASTGSGELRLALPVLRFRVNKKFEFGLVTQVRVFERHSRLNDAVASEIGESKKVPHIYPIEIDANTKMSMHAASFSDLGLTAVYDLLHNNKNVIFATTTIHGYNSLAYTGLEINNLKGRIEQNRDNVSFLTRASGSLKATSAGNLFSDFNVPNFFRKGMFSLGADFGLVYAIKTSVNSRITFAAQIKNIGVLKFKTDSASAARYDIHISEKEGLYFNNDLKNSALGKLTRIFDQYPNLFSRKANQQEMARIALPKTVEFDVQYLAVRGAFAGISTTINLNGVNKELASPSGTMLSIGWMSRMFSAYIPLSYYQYAYFNVGMGIRHRFFFIKSNSFITSALTRSRLLDFSIGFAYSANY
ncbi:hypothetical protein LZD49_31920 [Dyadobacter sp. CY261]|uniref:hypothetical protein n=1 Tax=Dyadobacter sp. CY261 TaxID=2907203 RepID=UPI001F437F8C|nr:hypothetical protein [Dyadobacter sp. CY261]MCF0075136.1 hypothetical protein [Dyadobacter sp. CY261]